MMGELQAGEGLLEGVENESTADHGSLAGSITASDPYELFDDIEAIIAAEGTLYPDTTNFGIQ